MTICLIAFKKIGLIKKVCSGINLMHPAAGAAFGQEASVTVGAGT
jgi:hypothetical protein